LELFGQLPLGEGRAFQIDELTLLDIDGKQIAVELVGTPLYFHGKPAAMAMFRDIRQRKQIEKERIKTQKLESLGVLAGGIAHDFNNILAGVMGNISLAREPNISAEELEESLAEAAEASIRARDLAKQLLTFAKGGSPIKKSHAISNLIREAARFGLRGSNVRCDLQLPEDLWPVDIDEGQILQVLHNIVINANQAMPTGGVLTIRAENRELDDEPTGSGFGRRVAVTLSDQGPGVPAESRARIFDPYFTTKDDGSGLGLAIAYSIARKHGGKLELLDTKSGATFRLTLPAAKGRLIALDPRSAAEQTTTMGGRILVVDDEPAVRKVAARILRKVGFEVECAETGEAAVERIKELGRASIDLVLLDLTIPGGMGGTETLDCLRAIDPHLKAIVFSGYSNNPVLASYRDYGFDGMVGKPFDLPQLTKTIRQVLKTDRKDATTTA
jgi:two-component system cell cycle sensor histidine kinase/response regulator CckA